MQLFFLLQGGIYVVAIWCTLVLLSCIALFRYRKEGLLKAGLPLAINLLTMVALLVYLDAESAQYLTDTDIRVSEKIPSPDKEHLIIHYKYDLGAMGYTDMITAVLPAKDAEKNLTTFTLPREYRKAKWLSNKAIEVEVDIRPYLAMGKGFEQKVREIGKIEIVVQTKGFNTSSALFVEHRALSPDSTKELVAYRYRDSITDGHLHISVIPEGENLPALGNTYIGNEFQDYVYFGEWLTPNKVRLFTTMPSRAKGYLSINKTGIEVELVEKPYPISGVVPGWYHKPKYAPEEYLERELEHHGTAGVATIKGMYPQANRFEVLYIYKFKGRTYSATFWGNMTIPTRPGETLQIMFSTRKPDVHKIIR